MECCQCDTDCAPAAVTLSCGHRLCNSCMFEILEEVCPTCPLLTCNGGHINYYTVIASTVTHKIARRSDRQIIDRLLNAPADSQYILKTTATTHEENASINFVNVSGVSPSSPETDKMLVLNCVASLCDNIFSITTDFPQDEDLLAEFDDHDYNANYASFGKDLVGSIMFGNRINTANFLTVQRQRQVASRHQQILKDYNRKFIGPLQRTVAKWCQNKKGHSAMHVFLTEVGSMAISRTGYNQTMSKLVDTFASTAQLFKAANVNENCVVQLAMDNINWKNKKAQKDRMPETKSDDAHPDSRTGNDTNDITHQHHNHILARWDIVTGDKLLEIFPTILSESHDFYEDRRNDSRVIPEDYEIVKQLGFNMVDKIIKTRTTGRGTSSPTETRTHSPKIIKTEHMQTPAYPIRENSFFENLIPFDLNKADTCILIYEETVDMIKSILRDVYEPLGKLTQTEVHHPGCATPKMKYHIELDKPAVLPLLGAFMAMDGKPHDEIEKHKAYRRREGLDDDYIEVTKMYLEAHPKQSVELVHNYSGDFHHSKDVAEMVMKVEFQDHIEPIVNNPDLGGGRQSQTSQSWLEYPGQDPEQWETEMPQLISATIDHVYELLEAAGEETTVEAVWRYLLESAAVCKQARIHVTFVVKVIMILGQLSASRWCDLETLEKTLVFNQYAYTTGGALTYHKINNAKIRQLRGISQFQKTVLQRFLFCQLLNEDSKHGMPVDETVEKCVQAVKMMANVSASSLEMSVNRQLANGCNNRAKSRHGTNLAKNSVIRTELSDCDIDSVIASSSNSMVKNNYMYGHTRYYLQTTGILHRSGGPREHQFVHKKSRKSRAQPERTISAMCDDSRLPNGMAVTEAFVYDGHVDFGYKRMVKYDDDKEKHVIAPPKVHKLLSVANAKQMRRADEEASFDVKTLLRGVLHHNTYYPSGTLGISTSTASSTMTMSRSNSIIHLMHVCEVLYANENVYHRQILTENSLTRRKNSSGPDEVLIPKSAMTVLSQKERVDKICVLRKYCHDHNISIPPKAIPRAKESWDVADEVKYRALNETISDGGVDQLPPFLKVLFVNTSLCSRTLPADEAPRSTTTVTTMSKRRRLLRVSTDDL
eukprot:m.17248 g.17248  ORF g.17248 m.17248 type:complete len:1107 (-) comp11170_c0_seq3:55-3375(-)